MCEREKGREGRGEKEMIKVTERELLKEQREVRMMGINGGDRSGGRCLGR